MIRAGLQPLLRTPTIIGGGVANANGVFKLGKNFSKIHAVTRSATPGFQLAILCYKK